MNELELTEIANDVRDLIDAYRAGQQRIATLERELSATREHLRNVNARLDSVDAAARSALGIRTSVFVRDAALERAGQVPT